MRTNILKLLIPPVLVALLAVPPTAQAASRRCPTGGVPVAATASHSTCLPLQALRRARTVASFPGGAAAAERFVVQELIDARTLRANPTKLRAADEAIAALARNPAFLARFHQGLAAARAASDPAAGIISHPVGQQQPGETGQGVDAYFDGGDHLGFGMGVSDYTTECPKDDGSVPLRATRRMRIELPIPMPHRMKTVLYLDAQASSAGTGHVGEDARLKDFDIVTDVAIRVSIKVLGPAGLVHAGPRTEEFHVHIEAAHVAPDGPVPEFRQAPVRSISWLGSFDQREGMTDSYLMFGQLITAFRHDLASGQHDWYDLGYCVRVRFETDSLTLAPGDHRRITATITDRADGKPVKIVVHLVTPDGGLANPTTIDADGTASYDYRPPSKPGITSTYLRGVSKRGRTSGDSVRITVKKPDTFPYFYKVLATDFHEASDARQTGTVATCNANGFDAGGSNDFAGSSGALSFDKTNTANGSSSGPVSGQVFARVPARWHQHLFGCKGNGDGTYSTCTADRTDTPGGGTSPIGFHIEADSQNAVAAILTWSVGDAFVGYSGGGDQLCNVYELRQFVEYADKQQQVPMSTLSRTTPFTLTFKGGPLQWAKTNINQPVSLSFSWSYSITLQRVDASGQPLS